MNKRLPYLFLLAGVLGMAVYPRFLPGTAPAALRTDFAVGLVYGVCIGLELLAVAMASRNRPRCV